jgi:hypothetical protein
LSCATSVQGGAESIILSARAESIILLAPPAESMILSVPPAESIILSACAENMILSAGGAESIIFSAGGAKQQSTISCSKNVATMAAAEATVAVAKDLTLVVATITAVIKWSRRMREREVGDDMRSEGIRLGRQSRP